MRALSGFFLIFLCAVSSYGQAPPDTTFTHEVVTVTATRTAVTPARAPARVALIDSSLLARTPEASVASLLQAHGGLFVRRYGPHGLASITLRGTGSSQTLILLDGQRISDPQLGQIDLTLLPTHILDGVEVMHGAASALHGSDGMGGVVNLKSAAAPAHPLQIQVSSFAGAFGERGGNTGLSMASGHLGATAAFQFREYRGDFSYEDRGFVPARTLRRQGADGRHWSAYSAMNYRLNAARLSLSALYTDAERGLPSTPGATPVGERQWDNSLRVWSRLDHPFRNGTITGRLLLQRSQLRYLNPRLALDQTGSTLITSTEIETRQAIGRNVLAGLGVLAGTGSAAHPRFARSPVEYQAAVFAHASVFAGPLVVYPSARVDYFRSDGTGDHLALNPRLGLNLQVGDSPLHLKASAGQSFRTPTFNDRFWQPGGNPNLVPERGSSIDAGVYIESGRLHLEGSVFHSQISDQIVWLPSPRGYWSPVNLSRVGSSGVEFSSSFGGTAMGFLNLNGSAIYTLTNARDRSDPGARTYGRPLRYVPAHVAKGHFTFGAGRFEGGLSARFTGRRFVTADGSTWLDPFVEMDATAASVMDLAGTRIRLALDIENIFDRPYEIIQGHPMPGRHARARIAFVIN